MTSPTSGRSSHLSNSRPCGFTLIELVVVIMVIALLAGIVLPMILKAQRTARNTRTAADLQTIGMALEAYHTDFGDYPRVDTVHTGFAVLGKALVAPDGPTPNPSPVSYQPGHTYVETSGTEVREYVAVTTAAAAPPGGQWRLFFYSDGAPGPGFRVRAGGRVYPPYLQADKFKMQGLALLDLFGNPILYYPARSAKPNLSAVFAPPPPGVVGGGLLSNTGGSLYNHDHNPNKETVGDRTLPDGSTAQWPRVVDLRRLLGDWTDQNNNGIAEPNETNGAIDTAAGETAAHTGPYILWSAGADNRFGLLDLGGGKYKFDDVANFQFRNVPE